MPSEIELAGRLGAALVLGGAIGLEREVSGQVAGLRTHMTVALGSALFAIVSAYGFGEFVAPRAGTNVQVDVARVASNIVTGVGFLGGGAILKEGASVRGLTTAASLWVTAAVGLAVAMGLYSLGAICALALIFSLTVLRGPRLWLRRRFTMSEEAVQIRLRCATDAGGVVAALRAHPDLDVRSVSVRDTDDEIVVEADVKGPDIATSLAELAARNDVVAADLAS